jgi:hypothetical protein
MHIHAYILATHTYIHTCIHAYILAIHANQKCMYIRICIHTHKHIPADSLLMCFLSLSQDPGHPERPKMYVYMYTPYTQVCIPTDCLLMRFHSKTYTHSHANTHTQVCIPAGCLLMCFLSLSRDPGYLDRPKFLQI